MSSNEGGHVHGTCRTNTCWTSTLEISPIHNTRKNKSGASHHELIPTLQITKQNLCGWDGLLDWKVLHKIIQQSPRRREPMNVVSNNNEKRHCAKNTLGLGGRRPTDSWEQFVELGLECCVQTRHRTMIQALP